MDDKPGVVMLPPALSSMDTLPRQVWDIAASVVNQGRRRAPSRPRIVRRDRTAIALFVDAARLLVYLATQWRDIARIWPLVGIAVAAVVVGTALGARVLAAFAGGLPPRNRRVAVCARRVYGAERRALGNSGE
jgi:hypothetical protein